MSTATYAALTLPVLMGVGALAVDQGLLRSARSETQSVADAAAIAAALAAFDATSGNEQTAAYTAASSLASRNLNRGIDGVAPAVTSAVMGTYTGDPDAPYNPALWTTDATGQMAKVEMTATVPKLFGVLIPVGVNGRYTVSTVSIAGRQIATTDADAECLVFGDTDFDMGGNFTVNVEGGDVLDGSVCTNATTITASGSSDINASVHAGPGGETIDQGGTHIDPGANTDPLADNIDLEHITIDGTIRSKPALPTSGTIGSSDPDNPAVYYLNVSSLNGGQLNSVAQVTGYTTIYVEFSASNKNSLRFNAGVFGNADHPEYLQVLVGDSSTNGVNSDITMNGNATNIFYGLLYAPETEIKLNGTAGFYGVLVAEGIKNANANGNHTITIDPDLKEDLQDLDEDSTGEVSVLGLGRIRLVR